MTNGDEFPVLVSVEEAARNLGIGRTTAWALIKHGALETVRIGRRTLVKTASIRRLAEAGIARVAADE